MRKTIFEPFKIKMVEPIRVLSVTEREAILKKAGYNLFLVKAEEVTFDFLTDSGTTAMSTQQWSQMLLADESYAGSRSFYRFKQKIESITGYSHVFPAHQGRAAERVLFSVTLKPGQMVPSNNHFDTTRANIEQNGALAVDLVCEEGKNPSLKAPFKGNINLEALEKFCAENRNRIPLGMMTITNNTGGGQPVSLENIQKAGEIYRRYKIPFILDACRFAENSYFIKQRESRCSAWSVKQIVEATFAAADGCMVSAKKDALVNMGGFIALKENDLVNPWVDHIRNQLILTEGFPTYGGLAARDLEAIAAGLEEVMSEEYLQYRLAVTRYFAEGLNAIGVPTVQPPGGHAVYIDAKAFLPHIPVEKFPGQALVAEMYRREGMRTCEIGSAMFGKWVEGKFQPHSMELVRIAIPRRAYTQSHVDYLLEGLVELVEQKASLKGMRLVYEPPFLRHFTARFDLLSD